MGRNLNNADPLTRAGEYGDHGWADGCRGIVAVPEREREAPAGYLPNIARAVCSAGPKWRSLAAPISHAKSAGIERRERAKVERNIPIQVFHKC